MHRYELRNDPIQFLVRMFGLLSEYISPYSISTSISIHANTAHWKPKMTLLTVQEDTKWKGQRRTEKRNDQMDQDGDGAYMKLNFNPSGLLQALMHLKNQLPGLTLVKPPKVISSAIWQLPEHRIYLLNKTHLAWGKSKWTWEVRREPTANIASELWQVSGWIMRQDIGQLILQLQQKGKNGNKWACMRNLQVVSTDCFPTSFRCNNQSRCNSAHQKGKTNGYCQDTRYTLAVIQH